MAQLHSTCSWADLLILHELSCTSPLSARRPLERPAAPVLVGLLSKRVAVIKHLGLLLRRAAAHQRAEQGPADLAALKFLGRSSIGISQLRESCVSARQFQGNLLLFQYVGLSQGRRVLQCVCCGFFEPAVA